MRIVRAIVVLVGVIVIIAGIGAAWWGYEAVAAVYNDYRVPTKDTIMSSTNTGIILYDRNGKKFFEFDTPGYKQIIPYSSIPKVVREAVVAAEDREFYTHHGFSIRAIARAAFLNYEYNQFKYGGSGITQQLVKNTHLSTAKNIKRKLHEVILAYKLEQDFTKEDILEMYLNTVYFGEGAYGIEAAAQTYFSKPAYKLTLAEASMLMGLLPAPTTLSPISGDPIKSKLRQDYVLQQMYEEGFITSTEKRRAEKTTLTFAAKVHQSTNREAPHFALLVRDALYTYFPQAYIEKAGLRVKTTLDLDWQHTVEQELRNRVAQIRYYRASNGAVVVVDPGSHEVRALAGSIDWFQPQFGRVNMATSPRQPGSSFKPIVYAAGLENKTLTPSSILQDKPITFGKDYRPRNYNGRYRGQVTLREALANSLNIPAVDAATKIGLEHVTTMAKHLGISSLSPYAATNPSTALGTEAVSLLELTNAYATFADHGMYDQPQVILEIRDKYNEIVVIPNQPPRQVLSPQTAFMISSILSDAKSRAQTFGSSLTISRPAAVKTGTTQDYRDAWTLGYTPQLAIGVWIGNNDNTAMHQIPGVDGAAPLWKNLMERFSQNHPQTEFIPPQGLITTRICPGQGLLVRSIRAGYEEYFIPGTEPTTYCTQVRPSSAPTPEPSKEPLKKNAPKAKDTKKNNSDSEND